MKPIRIFRHIDCEGPGYLLDVLSRMEVPHELVCIDQGDAVPEQIDDVSGLVFMGGSMSVNDDLSWIRQEIELIQQAAKHRLPVLGHCLGGQLMAKALGGRVIPNRVQEIGWFEVQKTVSALSESWLEGLPDRMEVFHWHGEMFTLPDGAKNILFNENCPHQGFALENMLAMQCHIEMTEPLITEWATRFADQLQSGPDTVQPPEEMLQNLPSRIRDLNSFADKIYSRWLEPIIHHA